MTIKKKPKIFLGIPSTGTRSDPQVYMLRDLEARYKDHVELVYPEECCHRIFHDFARNGFVEEFLKSDCDMIWFLDSDVVPPKHVLDLVTMHGDEWKLAGAPYPVFMQPPGGEHPAVVMCVYKGTNGKGLVPTVVPMHGTEFVDGLATGCLFIKREVLEQMEAPYFEFKFDPKTRMPVEGEDLGFCLKMKEKGIPFFVDYGMVCKHYKNVDLLEVNNYTIDFSNKNIMAYDAQVKGQVDQLVEIINKLQAKVKKYESAQVAAPQSTSGLILPDSVRGVSRASPPLSIKY